MLTRAMIETAQPKRTAYALWDDELAGFGCRIFPSGKRSFIVQYRLQGSRRTIRMTLGPYGRVTVTEARARARQVLAQASLGTDPQAAKKAQRAEEVRLAKILTVDQLAETYLAALRADSASSDGRIGRPLTAHYISDTTRHIAYFTVDRGKCQADAVTRAEILRLLDDHIGAPGLRRQLHGAICRMYTWAQQRELVHANPVRLIKVKAPAPRTRAPGLEELARIWHAAEHTSPLYRDVVRMLMITGQRRSEVGGMQWGEIDLAKALWTLPAPRTKPRRPHVVPLPPLAMEILQRRRGTFGARPPEATEWVFASLSRDRRRSVPIAGWNRVKRLVAHHAAAVSDWNLHDFRRSLVTSCAEAGVNVVVLDTLLNHAAAATRGGVLGLYQRATLVNG